MIYFPDEQTNPQTVLNGHDQTAPDTIWIQQYHHSDRDAHRCRGLLLAVPGPDGLSWDFSFSLYKYKKVECMYEYKLQNI